MTQLKTVIWPYAPAAWLATLRRKDLRCWRLIVNKGGIA
jgi:hypothetical protein